MYNCKILIVDDDEIIRQGIEKNIPWADNGFQVAATAGNGLEGLKLVKIHQPQIIITDIRMPFMDGLGMVEKVKELFPETKVIFLTAYEDFEYAKQAVHLKANEYILKVADNKEILGAALKARDELAEVRNMRERSDKGSLLLKYKFLGDLALGKVNEERMENEGRLLDISFSGNQFCVAVIGIDDNFNRQTVNKRPDLEPDLHMILKICDGLLYNNEKSLPFLDFNHYVSIIFNCHGEPNEANEPIADLLEEINARIFTDIQIKASIGIGNWYEGYPGLASSYREASYALEIRNILHKNGIIHIDSVRHNENSQVMILKQITEFIHKNYNYERFSLHQIAKEVHISPTYICTLFKKHMGINLSDYLIRVRIEKARELIQNTDLKTYEVAERVGYSNPQYFSVLFKKYTGYSPTEYRSLK